MAKEDLVQWRYLISNLVNLYHSNSLYSLFKPNTGLTVLNSFKLSTRENREELMFVPQFKYLENEKATIYLSQIFSSPVAFVHRKNSWLKYWLIFAKGLS